MFGISRKFREEKFFLGAFLLLALLIRILFVILISIEPYPDELVYDTIARNIVEGQGFSSSLSGVPDSVRPPLFPFLLAGIYYFSGYSHLVVKLTLALIGSLTCLFIYLITKEIFNKGVGIVAFIVSVIYPFLIYYTGRLLTETLFVFLLAAAVLGLIKVIKTHSFRQQICTGGLLGLAILTRPILLLFPLIILISMFFLFKGNKDKKKALKTFVVIFCTVMVVLTPWTIRNYRLHHELILISTIGGSTFWGANNPQIKDGGWIAGFTPPEFEDLSEVERSKRFYQMGFNFIRENPTIALRRAFLKIGRFWSLYPYTTKRDKIISLFSYGLLLPFSILGIVYSLKRWKKVLILYLTILYFTGMSIIFYGSTRFRLPIEPYIIIFGAVGINYLIEKIKTRSAFE